MSASSVPDSVTPIPLNRTVDGLVWRKDQISTLQVTTPARNIETVGFGECLEKSLIEFEENGYVLVGRKIGEGRQGLVYSIATTDEACLKVCRNERSAKQFRREICGATHFNRLSVIYPSFLGADRLGRWMFKARWSNVETGASSLNANGRVLPRHYVIALWNYVRIFEKAGLCVDWMPSNVVFRGDTCATFESTVWLRETNPTWSFASCFLPFWLPHGPKESSLSGFPPYTITSHQLKLLRFAWDTDATYEVWHSFFGSFPDLSTDWWTT